MKTIGAVVFAIIGTAVCFSLLPRSKAATAPSAPVGRYAITNLSPGEFALMSDTATGAVWQFSYADYCQTNTAPYYMRQVGNGEQCKEGEKSLSHIPKFYRVSVEGIYSAPIQLVIDANFQRQYPKPKQ